MHFPLCRPLNQIHYPVYHALLDKNSYCVFFDAYLLQNRHAEPLVDSSILLLLKDLNYSYYQLLVISHQVLYSLQG